MTTSDINSPCIGYCALNPDDICMGCFRQRDEICDWSLADNNRRMEIITAALIRQSEIDV